MNIEQLSLKEKEIAIKMQLVIFYGKTIIIEKHLMNLYKEYLWRANTSIVIRGPMHQSRVINIKRKLSIEYFMLKTKKPLIN